MEEDEYTSDPIAQQTRQVCKLSLVDIRQINVDYSAFAR